MWYVDSSALSNLRSLNLKFDLLRLLTEAKDFKSRRLTNCRIIVGRAIASFDHTNSFDDARYSSIDQYE